MKFNTEVISFEPTVEQRLDTANVLLASRQVEKALDEFLAVLEMAPELMYVHMTVGGIYARQRKYLEALAAFRTAMDLDPFAAHPPFAVAQVHKQLHQFDRAEEYFQVALSIDPRLDMAYLGLGQLALARQQPAEAISPLNEALAVNPDLVESQLLLADAYRQMGHLEAAIAQLEAIPADASQAALSRLKLAELYRERQEYDRVQRVLESFRSAYPVVYALSGGAQLDLGMAYLAGQDYRLALDELAEAPDFLSLAYRQHFLKGSACLCAGEQGQAIEHYLKAWQLHRLGADPVLAAAADTGSRDRDLESPMGNGVEAIRTAFAHQSLRLHYQSVVNLVTAEQAGWEVMLVWPNEAQATASPLTLPAQAESSGLCRPIGWWSLFRACHEMKTRLDRTDGRKLSWVSLRLSGSQLRDLELPFIIQLATQSASVPYQMLMLDVTASVLWQNFENNLTYLNRLQTLSVRLALTLEALDERALALINTPGITTLKLGHALVRAWASGRHQRQFEQVIAISRAQKQSVIALGVETQAQAAALAKLGCHFGGFAIRDEEDAS